MSYSWFLQRNGEEEGPITSARISEMAGEGALRPEEYIRRSDMTKWVPAGKVKGLDFRSSKAQRNDEAAEVVDEAITVSGKKIALLSNGTWRLSKQDEQKQRSEISATVPSQLSSKVFRFRKSTWGASELEVRDSEEEEPNFNSQDALIYDGQIAGSECKIIYVFVLNQLVRAQYRFTVEHSNDNQYINDFLQMKELLIEKYGRPISRNNAIGDAIWMNDLYENDSDNWGMAVSCGHVVFICEWDLPDTKIGLVLRGDNYEIQHCVEYVGKSYEALEDETKQQKYLEDL